MYTRAYLRLSLPLFPRVLCAFACALPLFGGAQALF